jgi:UDP-N-acetylmuramyl pentapeptide phosphotransferase/UDP-N-acetylglucosamine-1-phosphate transferase
MRGQHDGDLDMTTGLIPLFIVAFLLSAGVTFAMVRQAKSFGLLDAPGKHRSHAEVTPRAGGVGIAAALVAVLASLVGASEVVSPTFLYALLAGVLLVAGIGLADDRVALPAWPRLLVHLVAAGLVAVAGTAPGDWLLVAIVALGIAWSINLHNFMDGSNGLLAGQAAIVLGALTYAAGFDLLVAALCGAGAAATFGFVPFNFPRARIFLGDVGSGTLGLVIGIGVWLAHARGLLPLPAGLVLVSAFLIDATLTLGVRIATRQRFTERHREHLYQYLLRSGASHARVAALYWAWTAAAAWLALFVMRPLPLLQEWRIAAAVAAAGVTIWFLARAFLRRRLRED